MATAPIAPELEVLDLRHFSARQLRPLLETEARLWRDRLDWDYTASTELLLGYLESRILQGYVALSRGAVCGYTFCVYEGNKAVIGDAFAHGLGPAGDLQTTRTLLTHTLELLRYTPMVDRIESQILLSTAGDFEPVFGGPGFRTYPRLFLECNLAPGPQLATGDGAPSALRSGGAFIPQFTRAIGGTNQVYPTASAPPEGLPANLTLAPWSPQEYQPAGELIHAAYLGHTDSEINDQYRSLHGALRFLHNIVRFPGCGTFEPSFSWVLHDRAARTPVGLVLVSRVAPRVAHITQFCVDPRYRGQGLGSTLLRQSINALRAAGFEAITLTVTESNASAVRLYQHFGFHPRHRFDAMALTVPR